MDSESNIFVTSGSGSEIDMCLKSGQSVTEDCGKENVLHPRETSGRDDLLSSGFQHGRQKAIIVLAGPQRSPASSKTIKTKGK